MDETFTPSVEGAKAREIPNTEDARVIELKGEGWLIDNHFLQPRAMTSLDGRRRVVLNTSKLGENFERGKNWAPFVHQSRLFFVYSLSPLRILECDMPDGVLRWVHDSGENGNHPGLGDMLKRGGTNGVVHEDYVYGLDVRQCTRTSHALECNIVTSHSTTPSCGVFMSRCSNPVVARDE